MLAHAYLLTMHEQMQAVIRSIDRQRGRQTCRAAIEPPCEEVCIGRQRGRQTCRAAIEPLCEDMCLHMGCTQLQHCRHTRLKGVDLEFQL